MLADLPVGLVPALCLIPLHLRKRNRSQRQIPMSVRDGKNPTSPPKNPHITSEPVKKNMLILLAALVCWYRYLILLADLFVGLVPALSAATAAAAVGGCRGRGGGGGVFVGPPAKHRNTMALKTEMTVVVVVVVIVVVVVVLVFVFRWWCCTNRNL